MIILSEVIHIGTFSYGGCIYKFYGHKDKHNFFSANKQRIKKEDEYDLFLS